MVHLSPVGAFVLGTTSTRAKFDKVKAAGADEVIVHAEQDFVQEVKRLTDGKGAIVIYDGVGIATFLRGERCDKYYNTTSITK